MAEVSFHVAPATDIAVVDLWTDAVPDFGGVRAVRVEPRRWWLIDAWTRADTIAQQVRDIGAVVPIHGGLMRATLTGSGWRAVLMVSAVFDAEDPGFGPGDVAATVIHHVPVWIIPIAADCAEVYFAASYAGGLINLWTSAIDRGLV